MSRNGHEATGRRIEPTRPSPFFLAVVFALQFSQQRPRQNYGHEDAHENAKDNKNYGHERRQAIAADPRRIQSFRSARPMPADALAKAPKQSPKYVCQMPTKTRRSRTPVPIDFSAARAISEDPTCPPPPPRKSVQAEFRYGPFERKGAGPCGGRSNYVIKRFINTPANPNTRTTHPIIPATNPTFLCSNASAISARPHSNSVSLPRIDEPPPRQSANQPKAATPMRQWRQPARRAATSWYGSRDRAACGKRALPRSPPRRR